MSVVNLKQVKSRIIRPVLAALPVQYAGQTAENLLAYTFLAESGGGEYIAQLGNGPAVGPFQMEPATHDDCWNNFLEFNPVLAQVGKRYSCGGTCGYGTANQMAGNWFYAAFMCRVKYIRAPQALPEANDAEGIVKLWKTVYNSALGAGEIDSLHISLAEQAIAA